MAEDAIALHATRSGGGNRKSRDNRLPEARLDEFIEQAALQARVEAEIPLPRRYGARPGAHRIVQAAACIGRSFAPAFLAALLQQQPQAVAEPTIKTPRHLNQFAREVLDYAKGERKPLVIELRARSVAAGSDRPKAAARYMARPAPRPKTR
jgi:hypothetical protein